MTNGDTGEAPPVLAEAAAAGPAAFLEASSDMSMKSRKPNEVDEDELEQSR